MDAPATDLRFTRTLCGSTMWLTAGRRVSFSVGSLRIFGHIPETSLGPQSQWRRFTGEQRDAAEHAVAAGRDGVLQRVDLAVVAEQFRQVAEIEEGDLLTHGACLDTGSGRHFTLPAGPLFPFAKEGLRDRGNARQVRLGNRG